MTAQNIAKDWLAINRDRIEASGFEVALAEHSGEVAAVIEMDSGDILAQIHVFENGWVSCFIGTPQDEDIITPEVDDGQPTAENLTAMLERIMSYV